jgi:hypothetical protein
VLEDSLVMKGNNYECILFDDGLIDCCSLYETISAIYRSAPLGVYEGVLSFCPLRNAHITLLESRANDDTVL